MKLFTPVTILSEDEYGRTGVEEWEILTERTLKARLKNLQERGWEPIEVQVGESQDAISFIHLLED